MVENLQAPNTEKSAEDVEHEKKTESELLPRYASHQEAEILPPEPKKSRAQAFTWFLSVLALIISGAILYSTCSKQQLDKQIQLQNLLDAAWDYLGGEDGAPQPGTRHIWRYTSKQNMELASRKQKEASLLDPENPRVIKLEAEILRYLGKSEEAIKRFQMAIKADPKYASAYNGLGLSYREIYKISESISAFEKAKEFVSEKDTDFVIIIYNNLAFTIFLKGDAEAAIGLLKEALKIDPNHPFTLITLGTVYAQAGKAEEAIAQLNRALLIDNNLQHGHYNLGIAYYKHGQYEKALKAFETAVRLDPTDASAFHNLAVCLYVLNRKLDSIEKYETALYLDPDDTNVLDNLANLYRQLGRTGEADALAQNSGKLKAENVKPYKSIRGRITLP